MGDATFTVDDSVVVIGGWWRGDRGGVVAVRGDGMVTVQIARLAKRQHNHVDVEVAHLRPDGWLSRLRWWTR